MTLSCGRSYDYQWRIYKATGGVGPEVLGPRNLKRQVFKRVMIRDLFTEIIFRSVIFNRCAVLNLYVIVYPYIYVYIDRYLYICFIYFMDWCAVKIVWEVKCAVSLKRLKTTIDLDDGNL